MTEERDFIRGAKIVYRSQVMETVREYWDDILKSGWVILGDKTKQFEAAWSGECGKSHGVAMSNDTAALEVAMKPEILNLKGKKMIVPAQGYFSIVHAMDRNGVLPYFLDIQIDNNVGFTLDQVKDAVESDSTIGAVCLMPLGGILSDDALLIADWCAQNGIWVLEDAAHGHGAVLHAEPIGSIGDVACFSFYATKVLNTGEGGMLLTDNSMWAEEARIYRNYGRNSEFSSSVIIRDGNNFRMTEFTAALGLAQTDFLHDMVEARRQVGLWYDDLFDALADGGAELVQPVKISGGMRSNYYKYMVLGPNWLNMELKDKLKQYMVDRYGVQLSGDCYDLPIPDQPIYRERFGSGHYPQAREFSARHLCLPMAEDMTSAQCIRVVSNLVEALQCLKMK